MESIFKALKEKGTWIDLGAGVGTTALLYALMFPDRKAIGIEFSKERHLAGIEKQRELKLSNIELINSDLLVCDIPQGEYYFLYFPTGPVLDRILYELSRKEKDFKLIVIESHGDLIPRVQKEGWLKLTEEIPLSSPRHYPYAQIYEATTSKRSVSLPHSLSFQNNFLLIEESFGTIWLGDSQGLTWHQGDYYNLLHPPRTISWNKVREILTLEDLSPELALLVKLRRAGEVKVVTAYSSIISSLRKIILQPTFKLEFSNGEQVEWSEIVQIFQGPDLCYDSLSH